MAETGKIIIKTTKKGKRIVQVKIANKQPMDVPFVPAKQEFQGKNCRVERQQGQIIAVTVEGQTFRRQRQGGGAGQQDNKRGHGGQGDPNFQWSVNNTKLPRDTKQALNNCQMSEIDNFSLLLNKAVQFEPTREGEKAIFYKTDRRGNVLNVQPNYENIPLTKLRERQMQIVEHFTKGGWKKHEINLRTTWRMVIG